MKIVDAIWTPVINYLVIQCSCGRGTNLGIFNHRADRWMVMCPHCGQRNTLGILREQYLREEEGKRNGSKSNADNK